MKENEPFSPRLLKSLGECILVGCHPEAAFCVGMGERICNEATLNRAGFGSLARCQCKKSFLRFFRQSRKQIDESIFIHFAD
jgi:hypothetical protein